MFKDDGRRCFGDNVIFYVFIINSKAFCRPSYKLFYNNFRYKIQSNFVDINFCTVTISLFNIYIVWFDNSPLNFRLKKMKKTTTLVTIKKNKNKNKKLQFKIEETTPGLMTPSVVQALLIGRVVLGR